MKTNFEKLNLYINNYSPKFNNIKVEFDNDTATYKPNSNFKNWLDENFCFEPKSIIAIAQSKQMENSCLKDEFWREDIITPADGYESWKTYFPATKDGVYYGFCYAINYLKDFVYTNQTKECGCMLYILHKGKKQPAAIIGAEVESKSVQIKPKDIIYSVGFNPYCTLGKCNSKTNNNSNTKKY